VASLAEGTNDAGRGQLRFWVVVRKTSLIISLFLSLFETIKMNFTISAIYFLPNVVVISFDTLRQPTMSGWHCWIDSG